VKAGGRDAELLGRRGNVGIVPDPVEITLSVVATVASARMKTNHHILVSIPAVVARRMGEGNTIH
jgi:hypothetical protein